MIAAAWPRGEPQSPLREGNPVTLDRMPLGSADSRGDTLPASPSTRWLIDGPAQLRSGPERGSVGGVVDADGVVEYAYPEITGYYLQWLAWRADRGGATAVLSERATAAQRWLARWVASTPLPATRIHLGDGPQAADWRNGAVFFFDVAMVLRGVASAARVGLLAPCSELVGGLASLLGRLVGDDGLLRACLPRPGAGPLPERWSTRRGAFLAKAAAGVVAAAGALPAIPAEVGAAALRTLSSSLRALDEAPHDQVHPLLYAAEGFLGLHDHPLRDSALPVISRELGRILAASHALGRVPEFLAGEPGTARMDILAQTLRVAALLRASGATVTVDWAEALRLRGQLVCALTGEGTLPYVHGEVPVRHNVWATMFADQALAFAANDDRPPGTARDAQLVV